MAAALTGNAAYSAAIAKELEPALVNIASAGSSSAVPATAIAVATLRLQRNVTHSLH